MGGEASSMRAASFSSCGMDENGISLTGGFAMDD